jgi:hypothetical protein
LLIKVIFFFSVYTISITGIYSQTDTLQPVTKTKVFSMGGIFLSIGGGLHVPLGDFYQNSSPAFGFSGRLEYSSTKIFPIIVGGEINYFVFNGKDEYMNTNQLTTFKTKYLSLALNVDYSLSSIFKSTYTIPFLTADVKYVIINREVSPYTAVLDNMPLKQNGLGIGIGAGITLFIFDFYVKYNYTKSLSTLGAYAKVKFPIFKF